LLRPAEALAETRRVPGAAEAIGGPLDVAAALRRRDEVIHELDDSSQLPWLEDRGITLVRGHGRLDGRTARSRRGPIPRGGRGGCHRGRQRRCDPADPRARGGETVDQSGGNNGASAAG